MPPSVLLLAGHEPLLAELQTLLAELGCDDVRVVADGATALAEDVSRFGAVLVDLEDSRLEAGIDDAERLKNAVDAPVILLTSSLDEARLLQTQRAQPAGHVLKPVVKRELSSALQLAAFRKQTERDAFSRERWYKTTLRSIADAIITADDGAHITFMNPTAEQLTGWTEAEAIGRQLNDVFAVETEVDKEAGSGGGNQQPVLRLRTKSGATIVVEHNASPIIEDAGVLYGVVVIFRDITERRRIDQRLALSDRMASIGTLAAGIAHELNNPLAFVTSNLEFAMTELGRIKGDLGGKQFDIDAAVADLEDSIEALKEARDGAARAAHIVKDMKVFMRGDGDGNLLVDVNRAITLAVRLTSNEIRSKAELEVIANSHAPAVLADEGKLVQVLVNVLTNAVQALDEGPNQKIRISVVVDGDRVLIKVNDTGRGIAPEHLGRIFEPFFTTKAVGEGLGLGLSIAHTIITGFGGALAAESELGQGTTVTIALPSGEKAAAAGKGKAAPANVKGRVLVIDDETLIGTAIRRILTKHGIDVTVEDQGRAGFNRLAAGERFDVVLCDLMMPGFSGVDLYEALDDVAPDMKSRVVFMTGNAFTPKASELFENTRNVRLEKPFVPTDLTRAIAEVMSRHGAKVEI